MKILRLSRRVFFLHLSLGRRAAAQPDALGFGVRSVFPSLKWMLLILGPMVAVGCYSPDIPQVSTKLALQCGLAPSSPGCVDTDDSETLALLWERFILSRVTEPEVESCVMALECSDAGTPSALQAGSPVAEALEECLSQNEIAPEPRCMWQCLSDFFSCAPTNGRACDAEFVSGCLDRREACEHGC